MVRFDECFTPCVIASVRQCVLGQAAYVGLSSRPEALDKSADEDESLGTEPRPCNRVWTASQIRFTGRRSVFTDEELHGALDPHALPAR